MPTPRTKRKKKNEEVDALGTALDALDDVHASIIALAEAGGIVHETENELATGDGDDLPESSFVVGDDTTGPERGGGIVLDTRLSLSVSAEQAEALVFVLMREIRAGGEYVEVELDGRLLIGAGAARDFRRALKEG
ncbi:MAG: hypothetical protein ACRDNM_00075 [Gaiellaceae bacterium]